MAKRTHQRQQKRALLKRNKKAETPNTLQDQAWKRATQDAKPRTGYVWDWLDYEDMNKHND